MIRKITVNAELSRSANSNAKEENLIPENGTIYCGKVYTFVNAATYAEAIEIAKIMLFDKFNTLAIATISG